MKVRSEKDMYFIKKVYWVESIGKALKLSDENKYEESNQIYDKLLENKEDPDILEDLAMVYANKWFNFIELNNAEEARNCFNMWLELNPNDSLIHDWIKLLSQ